MLGGVLEKFAWIFMLAALITVMRSLMPDKSDMEVVPPRRLVAEDESPYGLVCLKPSVTSQRQTLNIYSSHSSVHMNGILGGK